MPNTAPGVSVSITTASANPSSVNSTGNWFALGTAHGPSGVAVPLHSILDFQTYFGQLVNSVLTGRYIVNSVSSYLAYDALDLYFRSGGTLTYFSRVVGAASVVATSATGGKTRLTAAGGGTWANSSAGTGNAGLILSVTSYTGPSASVNYTATVYYNGTAIVSSSALGNDQDLVNWINSLPLYQSLCVATYNSGGTTVLPVSAGSTVLIYLGSGTGATAGTDVTNADTDIPAALAAFTDTLGPGQVSFPGSTTALTYSGLTNHAAAYNRVAFLDGVDGAGTSNASTLVAAVATLQGAVTDASYAALFAPWIQCPGVASSNIGVTSGYVYNRTIAPSAAAAAAVARSDSGNDANTPAAGVGAGTVPYATGVSVAFNATDRATLNNGGVSVFRLVPNYGQIALYGFNSCAFDPNWQNLANVRFRMQVTRDFDIIGEGFAFQEIDGQGHTVSLYGAALAGQCTSYWNRGAIYGLTAGQSFFVNTGPAVNTPTSIASGQLNAQVGLRFSQYAEFVTISITKYSASATLPQ